MLENKGWLWMIAYIAFLAVVFISYWVVNFV